MLSGFKQFILRGNVVDLAVGVVIGAAFGGSSRPSPTTSLMPFIAAIVGKPDFSGISFHHQRHRVSDRRLFINAVVGFFLVAAAIYFFVVTPVNALVARTRKDPAPADPTTKSARMPERDPHRRPALHPLRPAGHGQGRLGPVNVGGRPAGNGTGRSCSGFLGVS